MATQQRPPLRLGITCHPTAGGSGILATELGVALARRGHIVHFVTTHPPFRLRGFIPNVFSHVVDVATYPLFTTPPEALALAAKVSEVAEENQLMLWHAHYAIPNAVAVILARDMLPSQQRFRVVTTLHGTDITLVGSDPSFFRMTRYALEQSHALTAVSDWLRQETVREFQIEKPVHTLYNFVDPERFSPNPSAPCHLGSDGERILMHISNFRPVKRVTDVVRVFHRVVQEMDGVRLVMVGEGPERMSAVGVAKQLNVLDKITFIGSLDNVEDLLPCAHVLLQPSEHESFGLVSLEAMSCEVPVVATRSGGITEVVEHGVCGFLCDVGNIEEMAGNVLRLLKDESLRQAMGRNGRRRAIEKFHVENIVTQYEQLYYDILSRS